MNVKTTTPQATERKEGLELRMKANAAFQREVRRDVAREERRQRIIEEYGADELLWA